MSVSDIPRAFREDTRVLLLFPSVAHGYLFHETGNISYIIMAIVALIPPSWEFSLHYIHSLDDFTDYGGWMVERVTILSGLLYLLLRVS